MITPPTPEGHPSYRYSPKALAYRYLAEFSFHVNTPPNIPLDQLPPLNLGYGLTADYSSSLGTPKITVGSMSVNLLNTIISHAASTQTHIPDDPSFHATLTTEEPLNTRTVALELAGLDPKNLCELVIANDQKINQIIEAIPGGLLNYILRASVLKSIINAELFNQVSFATYPVSSEQYPLLDRFNQFEKQFVEDCIKKQPTTATPASDPRRR